MVNRTLQVLALDLSTDEARRRWDAGEDFETHGHGRVNRESVASLNPIVVQIHCDEGGGLITIPWPPRPEPEKQHYLASALGGIRDILAELGWWALPIAPIAACSLLIAVMLFIENIGVFLIGMLLWPLLYTMYPLKLLGIEDFPTQLAMTWGVPLIFLLTGLVAGYLRRLLKRPRQNNQD